MNSLIILTVLLIISFQYFEVVLNRQKKKLPIDRFNKLELSFATHTCENKFSNIEHTDRFITQMCYTRDLAYTTKVMAGDYQYNYDILNMKIDINSPVTTINSYDCTQCGKLLDPLSFYSHLSNQTNYYDQLNNPLFHNCQSVCSRNQHIFDQQQRKKFKNSISLMSNDYLWMGQFANEKITFLGYNPKEKKSWYQLFSLEFEPQNFEDLEDLVTIKQMKVVAVDKMMNDQNYTRYDGIIGLGLEENDKNNQLQSEFLEKLKKQRKIKKKIFSLYISSSLTKEQEYVLTVGNWNKAYASNSEELINWVNINDKDNQEVGYYWAIKMNSMQFTGKEKINADLYLDVQKHAVLSLSTSRIHLPITEMRFFLDSMNSLDDANCYLVDKQFMVVYCENLSTLHMMHVNWSFSFENSIKGKKKSPNQKIVLQFQDIVDSCDKSTDQKDRKKRIKCLLNVQLSQTERIILGELFLRNKYTIFDMEQQRVGFMDALNKKFVQPNRDIGFIPLFAYFTETITIIFILGLLLIFCFNTIQKKFDQNLKKVKNIGQLKQENIRIEDDNELEIIQKIEQEDFIKDNQKVSINNYQDNTELMD